MLTGPELGAAIDAARKKKNITKKALAEAFQVAAPSVQGWVTTGRIDKSKLIEVIRFFSDVVGPEHWGLSKNDNDLLLISVEQPADEIKAAETSADLVLKMLEKHGKSLSGDARKRIMAAVEEAPVEVKAKTGNVITADFSRPGLVGDEISLAHYDVRGAMGGGQLPADYAEMLCDVKVSQQRLRELGVTFSDPNYLKVVTGWGQSMEPTIRHRDPLIVDVSIREFTGDGIYLFTWQGHLYIKRLQVQDEDHFEMISDNAMHRTRLIRIDETYIHARVLLVWNAHLL
ncbi:helix-turn-helix transcriptional regulator [Azotobacter bryophylli]|uniref:Helix-turn-helix transcriptional regulator n=1 Tax=Azotobacter bryophylli TaxID=1986537 RepID=A0ABV7B058_9GAMM